MDCIYLTEAQVEALYQLVQGKVAIGVQIEGDAAGSSTINCKAVLVDRPLSNATTIIEADGATPGWEH